MKKQIADLVPDSIGKCIDWVESALSENNLFYGHGTDNPGSEAQWLVFHVCENGPDKRISENSQVTLQQQKRIKALLNRRISEKMPLAYLLQEAWFGGHCFYVDERVLVPRSPIAELISGHFEPLIARKPSRILDLCCGSGCIGIACALAFPESQVVLADISSSALEVARINIQRFGVENRVNVQQSDVFAGLSGNFDLIVSNPPYVGKAEHLALPDEFHHEPEIGLVSDQEGLAIPLQILSEAAQFLNKEGLLILETGHSWLALEEALPELSKLWLEFDFGGEGVCAITAKDLQEYFHNQT